MNILAINYYKKTQLVYKETITHFLQNLQKKIIKSFEGYESKAQFEVTPWNYHQNGGGKMAVIRGDVFEKAAVHFSAIEGSSLPFKESMGPFFATGVSLITHMKNPHAPTVHMNVRYIETKEKFWFGGGYDLTPMGFFYDEDTNHFHDVAKSTLDPFDINLYPKWSQNAKEYFYIKHRHKERGVGGIFFDYYNSNNFEYDLGIWQAVGNSFLDTITPIYNRRVDQSYSDKDKKKQIAARAHYVEFNLLYDRGTKFGLESGGNTEAILSSLPPLASW